MADHRDILGSPWPPFAIHPEEGWAVEGCPVDGWTVLGWPRSSGHSFSRRPFFKSPTGSVLTCRRLWRLGSHQACWRFEKCDGAKMNARTPSTMVYNISPNRDINIWLESGLQALAYRHPHCQSSMNTPTRHANSCARRSVPAAPRGAAVDVPC
jgi:hypothetical protein